MNKGKVVVGISGGVDSAVTAYILKAKGFSPTAVTVRTTVDANRTREITEAGRVACAIDIPFVVRDAVAAFAERVITPFVREYSDGHTPNPCVWCNAELKWRELLAVAEDIGAEYVATGHYAAIRSCGNGRLAVAAVPHKDQSYMLYRLTQEQLRRTLFPLGGMTKEEVRRIAAGIDLPVAKKPDSQEICFVPQGDYVAFAEKFTGRTFPPGDFVDEGGKVLGRHRGIIRYTVGQRKGLNLAAGRPVYVKKIDALSNKIVIADDSGMYKDKIYCRNLVFMGIENILPDEKIEANVKIRYRHPGERALLQKEGDGVLVKFKEPVRAAAPGQSAVFYDDEGNVLGGGIIT